MNSPASDGPDLVLASASPRRRELLQRVGLRLRITAPEIDETPRPEEAAADYVRRMAADKVAAALRAQQASPADDREAAPSAAAPLAILAADTIVILRGAILGKPRDEADARTMLERLSGHRHEVTTAYRIRSGERTVDRAVTTLVAFRSLRPIELDAYLACGEWRGKAGAYAVQGIAGAFITELRGSHTNVIGLPVAELLADLQALETLPRYPRAAFGLLAGE